MIPKKIFYVWGVDDPKKRDMLACMESWRQNCPDYEIIEINEKSTKYFNFQKELTQNRWFKEVYNRKMWAYVADYIRIKTLYEHGGIYLDTDVTVIKKFDRFLNDPAFVGMQSNSIDGTYDYVEPAILGAQKGNPFLRCILDIYRKEIWELPIYTMPELFDWTVKKLYPNFICQFGDKKHQKIIFYRDINIYPESVFIPFRPSEEFNPHCILPQTHTIHWWGGSWVRPEILCFLKNKHLYSLKELDQIPLKTGKISIFGIPLMAFKVFSDKITCGRIILFSKLPNKKRCGRYTEKADFKLFGFIPVWKILEVPYMRKYKLFKFITFKIKDNV